MPLSFDGHNFTVYFSHPELRIGNFLPALATRTATASKALLLIAATYIYTAHFCTHYGVSNMHNITGCL